MAKLSEDLKRMLTGLAYQDVGEFLSRSEKMKVLNGSSKIPKADSQVLPRATMHTIESSSIETCKIGTMDAINMEIPRHIAFISNGEGLNAPLDYAIESSLRQNAQIDLLIHGAAGLDKVAAHEKKIREAGVRFQKIQIGDNVVESIFDYVVKQPSLIYIITTPEDTVAKALIENVSPKRNHIHVPFVLIKDEVTPGALEQTAA